MINMFQVCTNIFNLTFNWYIYLFLFIHIQSGEKQLRPVREAGISAGEGHASDKRGHAREQDAAPRGGIDISGNMFMPCCARPKLL